MFRRLKGARPSPALVISLVALFVSLGGVGYAAVTITGKNVKNNSLTGKDIKNSSLTGKDVKNNSLTGSDILESKLGKVPSARTADSASIARVTRVTARGTAPGDGTTVGTATATCGPGLVVVGGGGQVDDTAAEFIEDLWPSSATAFTARAFGSGGTDLGFTVFAICAPAAATG
jgi:hypothetical protein